MHVKIAVSYARTDKIISRFRIKDPKFQVKKTNENYLSENNKPVNVHVFSHHAVTRPLATLGYILSRIHNPSTQPCGVDIFINIVGKFISL